MDKKRCDVKVERVDGGLCIKLAGDCVEKRLKELFGGERPHEEAFEDKLMCIPVRW